MEHDCPMANDGSHPYSVQVLRLEQHRPILDDRVQLLAEGGKGFDWLRRIPGTLDRKRLDAVERFVHERAVCVFTSVR